MYKIKLERTQLVTGEVRLMYPHLFTPSAALDNTTEKYSVCLVWPKTDTAMTEAVKAAIATALETGKSAVFGGTIPKVYKNPLRDGDAEREGEEYAGMYFVNASTTRRPEAVKIVEEDGRKRAMPVSEEEVYGGMYGRVSINFFAFNKAGSKGVAGGLNNVCKTRDGERLGAGSTSAAADFDLESDFEDDGF